MSSSKYGFESILIFLIWWLNFDLNPWNCFSGEKYQLNCLDGEKCLLHCRGDKNIDQINENENQTPNLNLSIF